MLHRYIYQILPGIVFYDRSPIFSYSPFSLRKRKHYIDLLMIDRFNTTFIILLSACLLNAASHVKSMFRQLPVVNLIIH